MHNNATSDTRSSEAAVYRAGVPLGAALPISIVIPVHNSAPQLKLCLDALTRNRLEGVEIVVVDDASTDDAALVVQGVASRNVAPVSCHRLERRSGPAAARNAGMRAARNRLVLFLDADIILPDHGLESLRATLVQHSDRGEIAGVMGVYSESLLGKGLCSDYKNLHVCFLHKTTATISPYLHTPILCIDKQVLEEEGGFDTSLETAEDFRMGVKLGSKGYRFVIDRSVQGVHLKRYTLRSLLKEDWRRVRDLLRIQLEEGQQKFLYHAHRFSRLLSAALPLPTLAASACALAWPAWAMVALPCWLAFCACNLPFLAYVRKRRGFIFSVKSAGLLFLEMLCAQIALVYWTGRYFFKTHHQDTKTPST